MKNNAPANCTISEGRCILFFGKEPGVPNVWFTNKI